MAMKAIMYPKSVRFDPILFHHRDPKNPLSVDPKYLIGISKFESAAHLAQDISTSIKAVNTKSGQAKGRLPAEFSSLTPDETTITAPYSLPEEEWHLYPTGIIYKFKAEKLQHCRKRKIEASDLSRRQKWARLETFAIDNDK